MAEKQSRVVALMMPPIAAEFSDEESRRLRGVGEQLKRFGVGTKNMVYVPQDSHDMHAAGEIARAFSRLYWLDDILHLHLSISSTCEDLLEAAKRKIRDAQAVIFLGETPISLRNLARDFSDGIEFAFKPGDCLFLHFDKHGKKYTFKGKHYFMAEHFDLL